MAWRVGSTTMKTGERGNRRCLDGSSPQRALGSGPSDVALFRSVRRHPLQAVGWAGTSCAARVRPPIGQAQPARHDDRPNRPSSHPSACPLQRQHAQVYPVRSSSHRPPAPLVRNRPPPALADADGARPRRPDAAVPGGFAGLPDVGDPTPPPLWRRRRRAACR